MGNNNWAVDNLENALNTWNDKVQEIWSLLLTSPENFRGGGIWSTIVSIHDALIAIGLALLVLFFVADVLKTTTNFSELKRPEQALRLFVRFAVAKAAVTYGMELMTAVFSIAQGITSRVASSLGGTNGILAALPGEIQIAIEQASFWESIPLWIVTILGSLLITVLSFILIMTVYGRFFSLYIYAAISPIPLASFAGESTSQMGKAFLRSYAGICLQGAVIALACVIFTSFAVAPPAAAGNSAVQLVWNYIAELAFNLLILVGAVKLSERLCKEMLGL